jgi:hypothetical protein
MKTSLFEIFYMLFTLTILLRLSLSLRIQSRKELIKINSEIDKTKEESIKSGIYYIQDNANHCISYNSKNDALSREKCSNNDKFKFYIKKKFLKKKYFLRSILKGWVKRGHATDYFYSFTTETSAEPFKLIRHPNSSYRFRISSTINEKCFNFDYFNNLIFAGDCSNAPYFEFKRSILPN